MQFRAGIKTKWSCLQEEREEGGRIDKLNTKYRSECSRAKYLNVEEVESRIV